MTTVAAGSEPTGNELIICDGDQSIIVFRYCKFDLDASPATVFRYGDSVTDDNDRDDT
jgi:hypothetical protein